MAGANVTLDQDETHRALQRAVKRLDDPRPLFGDIGQYLLRSHDERWLREVDADDAPWAKLKKATLARKKKKRPNAGKLVFDDHLQRLTVQTFAAGVAIGSSEKYAATHQFGAPDRGIKARPFLGVSDEDREEINALAADYLVKALG